VASKNPLDRIKLAVSLVVAKPMKSANPETVNVNATPIKSDHLSQALAPHLALTKVFDNAPEMRGLFQDYYGFDIGNFAMMSPEQLGEFADMVNQAKMFDEMLPIIEQHVKDYITAKVNHDKFIANCIKSGASGMKSIDESTLQVLLEHKGYQLNRERLGRKGDNKIIEMEASRDDAIHLDDYTLEAALKVAALKLNNSTMQIDQRPGIAAQQAEQRKLVSDRKLEVKNLIQFGARGK
jgi:hypothetical protein